MATIPAGFSASLMKCTMATSSKATGWVKSISPRSFGMLQDGLRVAQVGQHDAGGAAAAEQGVGVHMHDRVVVHVDHVGTRRDLPGDLVHVPGRGDAGANVNELPYPRLPGQEPHRPLHKRPVRPCHATYFRKGAQHLPDSFAVNGIVVLAAEVSVVHPGRVRSGGVDLR